METDPSPSNTPGIRAPEGSAPPEERVRLDARLLGVSALMLFFEVLMIRWLSSEIRIFAYFHNVVLLFCFLGIGLGCARADRKVSPLVPFIVPLVLAVLLKLDPYLGDFSLRKISDYLSLDKGFVIWHNQKLSRWYLDFLQFILGTALFLGCMSLLTLFFIPFGQLLGKCFDRAPALLRAYGMNLLGSLAGVWFFFLISTWSLPPYVWFAIGGIGALILFLRSKRQRLVALCCMVLTFAMLYDGRDANHWPVWSPYQKLNAFPLDFITKTQEVIHYGYYVQVNTVGFMFLNNYTPEFQKKYPAVFPPDQVPYDHYNIPYRFALHPESVLVVGSGGGNDVAGALRNGAGQVTAVEIDPDIIRIGKELHPEHPYADPRVKIVNDDARSYFKNSKERFDLIIFGLLDSHTLSSSYSNVRLDNYVYTVESFQQASRLLKPGGVLFLIFEVSDDFIGARIYHGLTRAFGYVPLGLEVRSAYRGWGGSCFVTGNVGVIQKALELDPRLRKMAGASSPKFDSWRTMAVEPAVDDWPYLYLPNRTIPKLFLVIFGLLSLLSYSSIRRFTSAAWKMDWMFFFLGAGFLLLEVQNISKCALLFGATWEVNTVVISAILVMVILANAVCARIKTLSVKVVYAGLILSLAANYLTPISVFGGLAPVEKIILYGIFFSMPVFFAGLLFSSSFSTVEDRSSAFASNLFGAMIGGMAECLSFVVGIKALLILAAVFYVCAAVTRKRAVA